MITWSGFKGQPKKFRIPFRPAEGLWPCPADQSTAVVVHVWSVVGIDADASCPSKSQIPLSASFNRGRKEAAQPQFIEVRLWPRPGYLVDRRMQTLTCWAVASKVCLLVLLAVTFRHSIPAPNWVRAPA